ncbi:hypothetical protein LL947_04705 [Halomonas sp. BLK-85]
MLKPPITLSIVPSRYQAGCHGCLFVGGLSLAAWQFSGGMAMLMTWLVGLILSIILISRWSAFSANPQARSSDILWIEPTDNALQGRWLQNNGEMSHPHSLLCRYLGPYLICLGVGGRNIWLWPDSAPLQAQRELRRYLIAYRS